MPKKRPGRIWINIIPAGAFLGACILAIFIASNDACREPGDFWRIRSPEEALLRLHVTANSNLPADQAFKGEIVEQVQLFLSQSNVFHQEVDWISLQRRLPVLQEQLQLYAAAGGAGGMDIALTLREEAFPLRAYGRDIYPAGDYLALTITVGEGRGDNWWCLLFPPLCLPLAEAEDAVEPEAAPENSGEPDEQAAGADDEPPARQNTGWRFKVLDQWNRWFKNN